jgi:hypothetical protein
MDNNINTDVDVEVNELPPYQQPRDIPEMFFLDLLDPREVTDLRNHLEDFRLPIIEDDVEGGAPGLGNVFAQEELVPEDNSDEDSNDDDHEEGERGEVHEGLDEEGIDDEEEVVPVQVVVTPVTCLAVQPGTAALCGFAINEAKTCGQSAATCPFGNHKRWREQSTPGKFNFIFRHANDFFWCLTFYLYLSCTTS